LFLKPHQSLGRLLIAYQKCSNAVKITNYRDLIPINQIKGQMKITKKKLNRPTVKNIEKLPFYR